MSTPRRLIGVLATMLVCAGGAIAQGSATRAARAPNVVLVLADDLGIGDLGCYNAESKVPTPHLDALAAQSVRCTDAHSPSSVCSPTRYALLTGRYAWRSRLKTGVLWGTDRLLVEPGLATIGSVLQDAGYRTACFGKWHLGLGAFDPARPGEKEAFTDAAFAAGPHTVGFDESLVIPASLDIPPYVYVRDGVPEKAPTAETEGSKRRWSGGGGFWRKGPMQPGFDFTDVVPRFVRRAERFVRERAAVPEQPWFLYLPLPTPHTPWVPTEEFAGKSDAGYYGDFVAQLDAHMGRLIEALRETGQLDNTLFVFTSDNGSHWRPRDVEDYGHDAHLGYRGMKADIHEAGHRVPLLVHWPEVLPPGECDALIGLQDWFATIASIVDHAVAEGEGEDSKDLRAALLGESAGRTELVHHSIDGMFSLRSGDWKWIEGRGSGGFTAPKREPASADAPPGQLYDLAKDRAEANDLVGEREDIVERLRKQLAAIRNR